MKTSILFILLLSFFSFPNAQKTYSISFETNTSFIEVDTTNSNNIWEIGIPQKTHFNMSYSLPKAIVTDLSLSYPTQNLSSFQIGFTLAGGSPTIKFKHKYHTQINQDGGYIEASMDQGTTWELLSDTTYYGFNQDFQNSGWGVQTHNFYGINDTLPNGKLGFSGVSNDWIESTIIFQCLAAKTSFPYLIRFSFYSDNDSSQHDGWMIDDIQVDNAGWCSDTEELITQEDVQVFPNPFSEAAFLRISENIPLTEIGLTLFNLRGKKIREIKDIQSHQIKIERKNLSAGVYFYRLTQREGMISSGKLTVID